MRTGARPSLQLRTRAAAQRAPATLPQRLQRRTAATSYLESNLLAIFRTFTHDNKTISPPSLNQTSQHAIPEPRCAGRGRGHPKSPTAVAADCAAPRVRLLSDDQQGDGRRNASRVRGRGRQVGHGPQRRRLCRRHCRLHFWWQLLDQRSVPQWGVGLGGRRRHPHSDSDDQFVDRPWVCRVGPGPGDGRRAGQRDAAALCLFGHGEFGSYSLRLRGTGW